MNQRSLQIVCFASSIALGACVHASPSSPAAFLRGDTEHLVFVVASSATSRSIPDVVVSLVSDDGKEIQVGLTDQFGRVSVLKALIREKQAKYIIFTREHFFSGAIRADDDLLGFDESNIELAPLAVR